MTIDTSREIHIVKIQEYCAPRTTLSLVHNHEE